jgi:hypothetical protein
VAIRHRDALARDVALVFAPIALVMAISLLQLVFGTLPTWFGLATTVFLLAQPVFSLKLVSDIRGLPHWVLPLAAGAIVVECVLLVLTGGAIAVALAALGVFVLTEFVASGFLAVEARRRSGAARVRLAVAALATAAVAVAVLTLGAAAAGPVGEGRGPALGDRLLDRVPATATAPPVLAGSRGIRAQRAPAGRSALHPPGRAVGRARRDRRSADRRDRGHHPRRPR